jgi:threonine dehydratase
MQVPEKDQEKFTSFLNQLEYPYYNETDNLGYKLFLGKNS